jgi:hypothetical protein
LLIGISVNQLKSLPEGSSTLGLPVAAGAYLYTLFFVSSVYWFICSFVFLVPLFILLYLISAWCATLFNM